MTSSNSSTAKVWFITGCSSGFGREFALAALKHGDKVIATARNLSTIDDLKQRGCAILPLDVTANEETIKQTIADAVAIYGHIDYLINNAGCGVMRALEEANTQETLELFTTNFFGPMNIIRAVLPYMRERRTGTICNIGSQLAWMTGAFSSLYSSSKAALAAMSTALRLEVEPFGINVVVVDAGSFRTSIVAKNLEANKKSTTSISDYAPAIAAAKNAFEELVATNCKGDATKAAQLLVEVLTQTGRCTGRKLPSRLILGSDTPENITRVLDTARREVQEWAELAKTTDVDE